MLDRQFIHRIHGVALSKSDINPGPQVSLLPQGPSMGLIEITKCVLVWAVTINFECSHATGFTFNAESWPRADEGIFEPNDPRFTESACTVPATASESHQKDRRN